jgi:hypothetical protein
MPKGKEDLRPLEHDGAPLCRNAGSVRRVHRGIVELDGGVGGQSSYLFA